MSKRVILFGASGTIGRAAAHALAAAGHDLKNGKTATIDDINQSRMFDKECWSRAPITQIQNAVTEGLFKNGWVGFLAKTAKRLSRANACEVFSFLHGRFWASEVKRALLLLIILVVDDIPITRLVAR